ncbi:MAG: ABC transporter ATP-binding protein [Ignavibacteria bacterium RBG_16_34_14]|nr:MAG: ABC transporter ATP-binding protein [Ignavibacteria bacterium RBG_16_34_14]
MNYGFSKVVNIPYEEAVEKVTAELKKEGFGVLTSIDVKETLKKKIDVDFKKYVILGACNPLLAHKALQKEEELGLLLPCNIVVYEKGEDTVVSIFDPMVMMKVVNNKELLLIAQDVKARMERVLEAI